MGGNGGQGGSITNQQITSQSLVIVAVMAAMVAKPEMEDFRQAEMAAKAVAVGWQVRQEMRQRWYVKRRTKRR